MPKPKRERGRAKRVRRQSSSSPSDSMVTAPSTDSLSSRSSSTTSLRSGSAVSTEPSRLDRGMVRRYTPKEAGDLLNFSQDKVFESPHVDARYKSSGHARHHALNRTGVVDITEGVTGKVAIQILADRGSEGTLTLFSSAQEQDAWLAKALNHELGQYGLELLKEHKAIRITVGLNTKPFAVEKVVPSKFDNTLGRMALVSMASQVRAVLQLDENGNLVVVTLYPSWSDAASKDDAWLMVEAALAGYQVFYRDGEFVKEMGGVKYPYGSPDPIASLKDHQLAAKKEFERFVREEENRLLGEYAELGMPVTRSVRHEIHKLAENNVRKFLDETGAALKRTPVRVKDKVFYLFYALDRKMFTIKPGPYFYKKRDDSLGLVDSKGCDEYGRFIPEEKWLCVTSRGQAESMANACGTPKRRKALKSISDGIIITAFAEKNSDAYEAAEDVLKGLEDMSMAAPSDTESLDCPVPAPARLSCLINSPGCSGSPLNGRKPAARDLMAELDAAAAAEDFANSHIGLFHGDTPAAPDALIKPAKVGEDVRYLATL